MADTYERIKIMKRQATLVDGRESDLKPVCHYKTSAKISSLYGAELYRALQVGLNNTLVCEVRYCEKVKEIRKRMKEYFIEYDGDEYDIFAVDFRGNDKQYVQLKANRIE